MSLPENSSSVFCVPLRGILLCFFSILLGFSFAPNVSAQPRQEVLKEVGDEIIYGSFLFPNGDLLLLGSTTKEDPSGDFFITRISSNLDPIWSFSYGEAGNTERAHSAILLPSGNLFISGLRKNSYSSLYFEITSSGVIVPGTSQEVGFDQDRLHLTIPTQDNGYIIYGMLERSIGMSNRFTAYKYTNLGIKQWSKFFNQAVEETSNGEVHAYDAAVHDNGSVVFLGKYANFSQSNTDHQIRLFNLRMDGTVGWIKGYDYSGYTRPNCMTKSADGGFILAGAFAKNNAVNSLDMLVQKVDSDGNLVWQKTYGSTKDEIINDILEINGEIYAVGHVLDKTLGTQQAVLMKLSGTGDFISAKAFTIGTLDQFSRMHWDGSRLTLIGNTSGSGADKDLFLYSAALDELSQDTCQNQSALVYLGVDAIVIPKIHNYPEGNCPNFLSTAITQKEINFQKEIVCLGCKIDLDVAKDTVLCTGDSLVVAVPNPLGHNVIWNDGSNALNRVFYTDGNYWVELDNGDCNKRDSINLSFAPKPSIYLGKDTTFCEGDSVSINFTVPIGTDYTWNDGFPDQNRTIKESGLFWVEIDNGACTARDSILVDVIPNPLLALAPDTTLCTGDSLLLTISQSPGHTIEWENGHTGTDRNLKTEGLYWVEISNGRCSARDSINLKFVTTPFVELRPDTTLCGGDSLAINATIPPGHTFNWNDGFQNANRFLFVQGQYWLEVANGGCKARDSIYLGILPSPSVNLGPDSSYCIGDSVIIELNYPQNHTILWEDGSNNIERVLKTAGVFWAEISNDVCATRDSITLDFVPPPVFDFGPDKTFCAGDDSLVVNINMPPAYKVLWKDGLISRNRTLTQDGLYWLEISVANCAIRDSVELHVFEYPIVDLGPDTSLCSGDSLIVNGQYSNDHIVLWDDGSNVGLRTLDSIGIYWLEVDYNSCKSRDSIQIDVLALPEVSLGPDTSFCSGDAVQIQASFPPSYTGIWNDGETTLNRNILISGEYWLEVANAHCTNRDSIVITVIPFPVVSLGPDTAVCLKDTLNFNFAYPPSYLINWENGSDTADRKLFTSGEYWLNVSNDMCAARDTILLQVRPVPLVDLGPDSSICMGDSMLIDLGYSSDYLVFWNDGNRSMQRVLKSKGEYWAAVSLGNCSTQDTLNLNVIAIPMVDLGPDSLLCLGDSIELGGNYPPSSDLLWEDGSNSEKRFIKDPGEYWLHVNQGQCARRDSVLISFLPPPQFSFGPDTTLCEGDSVDLNLGFAGGYKIQWNDGSFSSSKRIKTSSEVWAEVQVGECTDRDSINLLFLEYPQLDLGPDTTVCVGDSKAINLAYPPTYSLLWENNSTSPQREIASAGLYWLEVSNRMCVTQDSINLAVRSLPSISLGPDQDTCGPGNVVLESNVTAGFTVFWENGFVGETRTVNVSGEYWANVVDDLGCQN
ncbi:MAG: hypothetical protein ACI9YL_001615, partial [Luteibaculaceae bacterium]